MEKGKKNVKEKTWGCSSLGDLIFLEREQLLSKISANPTVGFLRTKKQSGSTHRGLHVGTAFGSFRQKSVR